MGQARMNPAARRPKPRKLERRPQQRSVETRERLVDAALQEFASHGFDGATTRGIAQRAGVALAALPYHFTTKEALWRAAADRIFALLGGTFRKRFAGLEGVDLTTRLRLVLRDFVRFQAAHPELHRFMIQEGMRRSARLEWLVETHIRPLYESVRAMIEAAQGEGLAPIGRPEHLHYMLIGAASSVYALSAEFELLTGESADAEQLVAEHVAALERMYFAPTSSSTSRRRRGSRHP
jgi:TetR/AcrR family transcriptional regulator